MSTLEKINEDEVSFVSKEIQRKMPDHMEPGSLLHSLRCPFSFALWQITENLGLDNVPKIKNAFYRHINQKHFGRMIK